MAVYSVDEQGNKILMADVTVQPNWEQDNTEAKNFIQNKPQFLTQSFTIKKHNNTKFNDFHLPCPGLNYDDENYTKYAYYTEIYFKSNEPNSKIEKIIPTDISYGVMDSTDNTAAISINFDGNITDSDGFTDIGEFTIITHKSKIVLEV